MKYDPRASARREVPNAHAGMDNRETRRASMIERLRPIFSDKWPKRRAPWM
jgi:hypothetical protein